MARLDRPDANIQTRINLGTNSLLAYSTVPLHAANQIGEPHGEAKSNLVSIPPGHDGFLNYLELVWMMGHDLGHLSYICSAT